jgi:TP901 family phage tail tape measure protein
MEPVELNIVSPAVEMPGIDAAIANLNQIAELMDKIRAAAAQPINIQVAATGVEGVNTAMSGMGQGIREQSEYTKQLINRLGQIGGEAESIAKLEAGFSSAAQEAKYLGELYDQLAVKRRLIARDPMSLVNPDRVNTVEAAMNLSSLRVDEIAEQSRENLEAANGRKLFAESGDAVTASEKEIQGASERSAAALEAQDAIIKAKLLSLANLETRLGAAAQMEREFAAASKASQAAVERSEEATRRKGLLKSRTNYGEEGNTITDTVRNQDGTISKYVDDKELSRERDELTEHFKALGKIEADYAERQGREDRGSAGSIELSRRHAGELRQEVDAMKAKGLEGEKLAQDTLRRANELDAVAARQERALGVKMDAAHDMAAQDMLLNQAREMQQQVDRQYLSNRAQAQSQMDIVKATRAQADGYRELFNTLGKQQETPFGRMIGKAADRYEGKAAEMEADIARQVAAAKQLSQEFEAMGASGNLKPTKSSEEESASGRTVTRTLEGEEGGYRKVIKLKQEYNAQGELVAATQHKVTTEMSTGTQAVESMGTAFEKFGKTLGTVALWMTAYEVFFAALNQVKSGIAGMIEMEAHTAQLQSVMRGTKEQAQEMRDVVLGLAVAEGRSGDEAMDAAVRWERLGLSVRDTTEAVDISLKSANISGMTAAQSAEQFSAIYASYALSVAQLGSVFQETNAMAVRFNAADKDIMAGLARTGSVAHVAGLEISQTMAMIAEITGRTGRPGAESGNAMKRLLTNLSKPDVQAGLDKEFGISVKDSQGELKKESEILDELYLKYISLGKAEQQALLIRVAGAQQASRIAALMDGYIHAQGLEIQALGDLNRAEIENKVRRDTMQKDLQALQTEWQKLWVSMGDGSAGTLETMKLITRELGAMMDLFTKFQASKGGNVALDVMMGTINTLTGKWMVKPIAAAMGLDDKNNKEATADERQRLTEEYEHEADVRRARERSQAAHASALMAKEVKNQRDPKKLLRDLDSYTTQTFDDPDERDAFVKRLAMADNEGKIALLLEREKKLRTETGMLDDKAEASKKALIDGEQVHLKLIEQQRAAKERRGEDTKYLDKQREDSRRIIDQLKGEDYSHNEVDDEAEDPSLGYQETKKKFELMVAARRKIGDAFPSMGGIRSAEEDKIARERAALDAKEAMTAHLPKEKDGADTPMEAAIKQEIREKREALEIDEASAKVMDRIAEATRRARNETAQFRIGRNQTEEDLNEAKGAGGMIGGLAEAAKAGDVDAQAEVLQIGNSLTKIQLDLEERRYKLTAEIVNEKRKENEEASKSLMMADREEQLRAALIRKYTQENGGFTADNFQFLEQKTKLSIQKYDPEALPPELMTRSRELENESNLLNRELGGLRQAIAMTSAWMRGNIHPTTDGTFGPGTGQGGAPLPAPKDEMLAFLARQKWGEAGGMPGGGTGIGVGGNAGRDEMLSFLAKQKWGGGGPMSGGTPLPHEAGPDVDAFVRQLTDKAKSSVSNYPSQPVAPQIQAPVINMHMQFSDQFRQMTEHVGSVVHGELMNHINDMRGTWNGFMAEHRTESAQQAGTNY